MLQSHAWMLIRWYKSHAAGIAQMAQWAIKEKKMTIDFLAIVLLYLDHIPIMAVWIGYAGQFGSGPMYN